MLVDECVGRNDLLAALRVIDREEGGAAKDALGELRLDVARLDQVGNLQTVHGAAVEFADDDILHHVHQTAGEVTGVRGLERRVRKAFTSAVRGGEVLQHRESLAEARGDGRLDDFARRLGHQAAHAGQLAHLVLVASGTGAGHHVDRVESDVGLFGPGLFVAHGLGGDLLEHVLRDVVGALGPHVDDLVVFFPCG